MTKEELLENLANSISRLHARIDEITRAISDRMDCIRVESNVEGVTIALTRYVDYSQLELHEAISAYNARVLCYEALKKLTQ